MLTEITTLEPYRVRLQVASIFASVLFEGIYCWLNSIICRCPELKASEVSGRHLTRAIHYCEFHSRAFCGWQEVTCAQIMA